MKPNAESPPPAAPIQETAAAWVARRDAGLDTAGESELQAWLAADPRHRSAFAEYASAWSRLDRPMQGGAADDVLGELYRLERRQRRRRVLAGAAVAGVLLAGVSFWTLRGRGPASVHEDGVATARLVVPQRQALADGSSVELKDGAQIEVSFSAERRRVTLRRGEAHFQVAKDPARPFVVTANGVEVRAVGTAFAVQIGPGAVEVVVTEGRVTVDSGPAAVTTSRDAPAPAVLVPGQQVMIEPGAASADVRDLTAAELSARLAWRAPRLEFTGTPLAEVVRLLNEHAGSRQGVRFSIGDDSLAQVRVSGLFRADNTAALVELLESGFGIAAERASGSELVLKRAARL